MYQESNVVELKRELNIEDLKKEIVAFLNTNGGTIYIGIDDNGNPVGINNSKSSIDSISNMINDAIKPDASMFTTVDIITENNLDIIKIEVKNGHKKPYYIYNKGLKPSGVYIRHGSTSRPATEDSIKEMIKVTDGITWEMEISKNQDLTFDYATSFFKKKNIEFGEEKLKTLKFINNNDFYTNLGFLISDQCTYSIKVAVYNDTSNMIFLGKEEFEGSMLEQTEAALKYISLSNRVRGEIDKKTFRRIDTPDYPEYAIRESLFNAIVHRDYNFNGSIIVHIYTNRIEFVSLGGLVENITLTDALKGISLKRNEGLANVYLKLEYVESFGTGLKKIMKSYDEYDSKLKPIIEDGPNSFIVTLYNVNYEKEEHKNVTKNNAIEFIEKFIEKFTVNEEKILKLISDNANITQDEMAEHIGITKRGVAKIIKNLKDCGKIIRIGSDKKGQWKVNK